MSAALATAKTRSNKRQFQSFRFFSEKLRCYRLVENFEGGIDRLYNLYEATAYIISRRLSLFLPKQEPWFKKHRHPITAVLLLLPLLFILLLAGVQSFPGSWSVGLSRPVDALVQWMQINLYEIGETGLGTGPFRDFLIVRIFIPLGNFLTTQLPWVVIVLFFAAGAVGAGSWRLALLVIFGLLLIGLVGMWPFAMDTLSQTLVSVALCIVIGIPLGFWSAHNDQVEQVVRPILDFLQTIPIFVYLVPVIMLFGSGSVAGLIASVLYAIVPVVRLTNLGIRQVDKTILESAESFGSTSLQTLLKVEMPLALPSIMLGINQTIMMVLAMVIIAGLVGATGLGLEVVQGFTNDNLGRSVEAGLAIVLLAIVIDRITQAWAEKSAAAANI
jgi:glycine betaine/proline transport system permease protein